MRTSLGVAVEGRHGNNEPIFLRIIADSVTIRHDCSEAQKYLVIRNRYLFNKLEGSQLHTDKNLMTLYLTGRQAEVLALGIRWIRKYCWHVNMVLFSYLSQAKQMAIKQLTFYSL